MDYYGFIAFCIGLGWIPIAVIVIPIAAVIYDKFDNYDNKKG